MKGSCSTPNASVWNSNTQGWFWLISLLVSVAIVWLVVESVKKLPLSANTISIGKVHMEVRKCSTGLASLGLVIPLTRHATLTFSYWLREVNRLVFSSTPSFTQHCLHNRVSSIWFFLVGRLKWGNNWCSTLIEPGQSYYCTATARCFSNLLQFTDSVGTHAMIKPPVIKC